MSCYIASGYTYGKYLNQQNIELLTQSQSHEKITSVPPSSFPIWDVPGTQLKARAPTLILPTSAPRARPIKLKFKQRILSPLPAPPLLPKRPRASAFLIQLRA